MKTVVLIAQQLAWEQAKAQGTYTQSTITSTLEETGDFLSQKKADIVIDGLKPFEEQL